MSDIKLFSIQQGGAQELAGMAAPLEKDLQCLIEKQMEVFLGVRFLATEYATGKTHKGRIDSLGLDENGCPVIIEYKRYSNENVINQGLFYLDWLLDHRGEFQLLVQEKFGKELAESIEWGGTRLVCIAADFNKYDGHAVQQINRNIELMRYRFFGGELLLLELVNAQIASVAQTSAKNISAANVSSKQITGEIKNTSARKDTHADRKAQANDELLALYESVCEYADSLGDEVQRKELLLYTAFKRIKNFASVLLWSPQRDPKVLIFLKVPPATIQLENNFTADVSDKGHWGTGDLEVSIRSLSDLEKAKVLIEQSYKLS